jgi:uncharacterized protein (TIGR02265 family)
MSTAPMSRPSSRSIVDDRLDSELAAQIGATDFRALDLHAPLDVAAQIADTPPNKAAKGMFLEQLARAARKLGVPCDSGYVPFRDYPLREFMRLQAEYAQALYPRLPARDAFRRVGWEAFSALMSSVAGRVLYSFASGGGVQGALRLAPQAYKQTLTHCSVTVRLCTPHQAVLEFRDVWNFADCYQVGVVEGACRAFGVEPRVRARVLSRCDVDLLIRW